MSQKTNSDLLDFGQDSMSYPTLFPLLQSVSDIGYGRLTVGVILTIVKRMSADNITPPDTASRPREESSTTTTAAAEKPANESKTTARSSGSSNIDSEEAAAAARWRKDKSDGKD
ncbi:hypothetical protein TWF569_000407 [Orbilia oligospora]|nr:hypothetical protein TWF569_000407 [Orbilia oligospora]